MEKGIQFSKCFYNIEVYDDNSLIVAGSKHFSDTGLYQDSSFVQKMDLNANIIWTKQLCLTPPTPNFLKLVDGKIIFCATTNSDNSYYPNSKLFCLNGSGETEWGHKFYLSNAIIDKGVKAIKLKIQDSKNIYVLCQSYGDPHLELFKFDLSGRKINTYQANISGLKNNLADKSKNRIFLYTGMVLAVDDKKPIKIVIKETSKNVPYFTTTDADQKFVDYARMNGKIYSIADEGELSRHYSNWLVEKRKE